MGEIIDVKIGQSLPPERWMEARARLGEIFPAIAKSMEEANIFGRGADSARAFTEDFILALVAMDFVAHFASENCRYIPIPMKREGREEEDRK